MSVHLYSVLIEASFGRLIHHLTLNLSLLHSQIDGRLNSGETKFFMLLQRYNLFFK